VKETVVAFMGLVDSQKGGFESQRIGLWSHFNQRFSAPPQGFLAHAVRGFFANGGRLCHIVPLREISPASLRDALASLAEVEDVDLICAPDLLQLPLDGQSLILLQRLLLDHCETVGGRFALLDSLSNANLETVLAQRDGLSTHNAALYYPWIKVPEGPPHTMGFVPPCGHVAGVYARVDDRVGVHKAPANERLEGVLDLKVGVDAVLRARFSAVGINSVQSFPGRGIRVWGARTLSSHPLWRHVNVRRLVLKLTRWIEDNLQDVLFEPNDQRLWSRIERKLNAHLEDLFDRGALIGASASQAFYVKCDGEINPPEVRAQGQVIADIGVAPSRPNEYIVMRVIHGSRGVRVLEQLTTR
jgi:phage tail sheath protein FI